MIVTRHFLDGVFPVSTASGGTALPSALVCSPGNYAVSGVSYDMTAPGLYFFTDPGTNNSGRRVVAGADPLHFVSAMACAARHGARDNTNDYSVVDATARSRYVSLTCDYVSTWISRYVNSAWAPTKAARMVRFLTMGPLTANDNGHAAIEVYRNGAWQFFDADFGRFYTDASGGVLNARDFAAKVPAWDFEVNLLTPYADKSDPAGPAAGSFDYATYGAAVFGDDAGKQAWTQRICQAVGIDAADGNTYWLLPAGSESRKAWVEQTSRWKVDTEPAVWNARFY